MARSQVAHLTCWALVLVLSVSYALGQDEASAEEESAAYTPILPGVANSWDVMDKTLLELTLPENHGVWKAEGAQRSRAEANAAEGTLPNCTAYPNQFDFLHNVNDDQYIIFLNGSTPGSQIQVSSGHRETYYSNITGLENYMLTLSYEGEEYCQTWYTYLDRNTGQVKARTIYNGVYSQGADGEVEYTSLNCNMTEPVAAGCFEEPGANGTTNVRAASVFTWVCQQGECGALSPVFSQYDLMHPEEE